MAFTLVQAGATLRTINAQGGVSSALSLPNGVTLDLYRVPRFAKFNRYVVMVNTPTRPITIDPLGTVRPLTPIAPAAPLTLTGAAGGTLSGTYLSIYAYIILDALGNTIAHSDYSPAMTGAVTVATKNLLVGGLIPSDEGFTVQAAVGTGSLAAVPSLRLYRTVTNGSTYFKWTDVSGPAIVVDDVALTTLSDLPDASLGLFEAPLVGSVPDLTLIKEWQGRLWGVDRVFVDDLRYTESGQMYAWSALNTIPTRAGQDAAGITALIPRRNALGVARRDVISQITGISSFSQATIPGGEGRGCVSQESVIVDADVAYFLGLDGVYKWDAQGISCVSREHNVSSWFDSGTYFNRALFHRAVAQLVDRRYRLFLASAGSLVLNRWVEFDLDTQQWWGVHRTAAVTPTCTVPVAGADNQVYPMMGTQEGYVLMEQEAANDLQAFGIATRLETKQHGDPEAESYFGELSIWGEAQTTGALSITPTVGELDGTGAVVGTPFAYDMRKTRERLGRIGVGKHASLVMEHSTINEPVVLYGYTIQPVEEIGRR